MKHEDFMQMAIDLSEYNVKQGLGGPFGAVIVKDGMVIARSANKVVPTNDPTAHAEVSVIRLACQELGTFNLEGCEIYTSCEPCPMCLVLFTGPVSAKYTTPIPRPMPPPLVSMIISFTTNWSYPWRSANCPLSN
jgi:deoxycytidylate deaminase